MEHSVQQSIEKNLSQFPDSEILLDLKQVISFVAMTKSTIYRYMNLGVFPKQVKVNPDDPNSASRWKYSEIQEFINSRPTTSSYQE
jgi:predicted DNA-binding transcriptional regulator AlpA